MAYVDGFVAAVKTARRNEYTDFANFMGPIFKEFGALSVVDCWGDDVPDGETTSFPMSVKKAEDETVTFSWITWPSKEVRDAGMAKLMADERMSIAEMPFDGKRLIMGGFEVISDI